jgi:transcription elongation factor
MMAYRFPKKKDYSERDIYVLRKKYKGHLPSAQDIYRTSARRRLHIQERLHIKGTFIEYKDKVGRIEKVTDKGIHVRLLTKSDGIAYPEKRLTFISQKKIDEGKVYPTTFAETPMVSGGITLFSLPEKL